MLLALPIAGCIPLCPLMNLPLQCQLSLLLATRTVLGLLACGRTFCRVLRKMSWERWESGWCEYKNGKCLNIERAIWCWWKGYLYKYITIYGLKWCLSTLWTFIKIGFCLLYDLIMKFVKLYVDFFKYISKLFLDYILYICKKKIVPDNFKLKKINSRTYTFFF